jgi:hypothetical protein
MARRIEEIKLDDCAHHGMYAMLGVSAEEGRLLDLHQNKSRFLYRYAGSLTEKSVVACFQALDRTAGPIVLLNTRAERPKTVQVDCLLGHEAFEIKWRDATTDGDHVAKERMKVQIIADAGYVPVKLAFFEPQRAQARKIQASLAQLFADQGGHYYAGQAAWDYVHQRTGVDLWAQLRGLGGPDVAMLAPAALPPLLPAPLPYLPGALAWSGQEHLGAGLR